jgi:hypothetical protein
MLVEQPATAGPALALIAAGALPYGFYMLAKRSRGRAS